MGLDVGTMRRVDYYVGVPLCFIGTVFKKLFPFVLSRKKGISCKNVLFIGLSETGSIILAEPAIRKIVTEMKVTPFFICFGKNSPVLQFIETIPQENIFKLRETGLVSLVLDSLRFFFWARKKQIDTVIDFELFSRFTAILSGFSGAVRTVGFHAFYSEGLYRGDFFTHKVAYNPHQHIAKNFIALVNAVVSKKEEIPYSKTAISDAEIAIRRVVVSDQAKSSVTLQIREAFPLFDATGYKVILFNTNASDLIPLRRWPKEHFIVLASLILARYPNALILLTGVVSEISWNESIKKSVKSNRCINFAGMTTLADLPALYSISTFMVTNDSGPAHFASLTAMPTFVLFGPETPALYGPLGVARTIYAGLACSPCVSAANHRKSACNDNVCLKAITPEMVCEIIRPILDSL